MFRTAIAVVILFFYFGVVIWRPESPAVTVMAPALSLAVGALLGSDVVGIFRRRSQNGGTDDR